MADWKHKCLALPSKPTGPLVCHKNKMKLASSLDPLDRIILEALEQDPAHVRFALERVLERLRAEGRHSVDELEAAAVQLQRELGISRTTNWAGPLGRAGGRVQPIRPALRARSWGTGAERTAVAVLPPPARLG